MAAQFKEYGAQLNVRARSPINEASQEITDIMATQGGKIIPAQGALVIVKDGETVGAIGGSGGTAQQDEDCVRVGLAAL